MDIEKGVIKDEYEYVERLISEGAYAEGDNGDFDTEIDLSWVDPDLAAEGRKFAKSNYSSIFFGLFFGIVAGNGFWSIQGLLAQTYGVLDIKRQFRSINYFTDWLENNVLDKTSKSF